MGFNNFHVIKSRCKESVRNPKLILKSVLWDLAFFTIVFLLFFAFSSVITILSSEYIGLAGTNFESLLQELSVDELDSLFLYIRNVMVFFTVGLVSISLAALASFSFTRKKIWATINQNDYSFNFRNGGWMKLFSFIGLAITLLFFSLLAVVPLILIQDIFVKLVYFFGDYPFAAKIVSQSAGLLWFVVFLQLFFSIKSFWTKNNSVWFSVGSGFSLWIKTIKNNFSDILSQWAILVLSLIIILQILIKLFPTKLIIMYIIQILIYLFFISWSRLYFTQQIESHKTKH